MGKGESSGPISVSTEIERLHKKNCDTSDVIRSFKNVSKKMKNNNPKSCRNLAHASDAVAENSVNDDFPGYTYSFSAIVSSCTLYFDNRTGLLIARGMSRKYKCTRFLVGFKKSV